MLKITRLEIEDELVYDLTAPSTECFYANGVLVHNCQEIHLFSDEEHIFTCVLSSLNLARYDEWKNTDAIFWSTVFLDCIAEEFIQKAKEIKGLESAVRFTEKTRALGLGVCGFHTYLQEHMIPFESFEAHMWNNSVFSEIKSKALDASKWMADKLGEPALCKGYGVRNTHIMAIAPTKSTAVLMGGVSEGINPDPAMTYTQMTASGEVERINPPLLNLMKKKGVYTKKHIQEITDAFGSVQNVSWLSDEEKLVFRTAFEINQEVIIRLASQRQRFICQGQSVNLFLAADEDERWISHLHKMALEDKWLKGLYYIYTRTDVDGSKECLSCQ